MIEQLRLLMLAVDLVEHLERIVTGKFDRYQFEFAGRRFTVTINEPARPLPSDPAPRPPA